MANSKARLNRTWYKKLAKPLPDWHVYQGDTNDCGPFCATIAVNALREEAVADADTLARALEQAPEDESIGQSWRAKLLPARIKGWATFPWGLAYALRSMGFESRWRVGASSDRLRDNLDKGLTTIVIVGEPLRLIDGEWRGWSHYKILYAWDPKLGWAFVDPASTDVFSYQDAESFEDQWTWMGRNIIEVWSD